MRASDWAELEMKQNRASTWEEERERADGRCTLASNGN